MPGDMTRPLQGAPFFICCRVQFGRNGSTSPLRIAPRDYCRLGGEGEGAKEVSASDSEIK